MFPKKTAGLNIWYFKKRKVAQIRPFKQKGRVKVVTKKYKIVTKKDTGESWKQSEMPCSKCKGLKK